jgi:hypothetical protein
MYNKILHSRRRNACRRPSGGKHHAHRIDVIDLGSLRQPHGQMRIDAGIDFALLGAQPLDRDLITSFISLHESE